MKQTKLELTDYAALSEGLTILLNCFEDILESTGERDLLLRKNKRKVVEAYFKAKDLLPKERLKAGLGISEHRILQWASDKKCEVSMLKKCFNIHSSQLTLLEQDRLKQYFFDPENQNLPRSYIWAKARREGFFIGIETYWKYVHAYLGYIEAKPYSRRVIEEPIMAEKPFEILHMDSTLIKCRNGERLYVHLIMDNYSRKILGAVPSYSIKSEIVASNLKQVIAKRNLYNRYIRLYSDDGPENHGYITELLQSDKRIWITHHIGAYHERNNNMIERFNFNFKYIILKKYTPKSFDHLEETLPEMISYYNNMYLPVLKTLSPNEAIRGKKAGSLKEYKSLAPLFIKRIKENRQVNCESLCPFVKPAYVGKGKRRKL